MQQASARDGDPRGSCAAEERRDILYGLRHTLPISVDAVHIWVLAKVIIMLYFCFVGSMDGSEIMKNGYASCQTPRSRSRTAQAAASTSLSTMDTF